MGGVLRRAVIRALVAAGALLVATPAMAAGDIYDCTAVVGEPPVAVQIIHDYVDDKHVITRASMQVEGDIGYATDSTEPTALVTVADLVIDSGLMRMKFHYKDGTYEANVAEVALVSLSEGAYEMTGGVLSLGGGGLWTLSCTITYETPQAW